MPPVFRTESEDDEPPPLPQMPNDIPEFPNNNNGPLDRPPPFSSGLNNNSSTSFSSEPSITQSQSISSSKTNFHVATRFPDTQNTVASQLYDRPTEATPHSNSYDTTKPSNSPKPDSATIPSLALSSLAKNVQHTVSSSTTNHNDFSDDEDDAFRESTNSFYSAAEQPSTEDLRGAYNNTFTKNLQSTQKPIVNSKNALGGFGASADRNKLGGLSSRPTRKPLSRVPIKTSQPTISLSPSVSNGQTSDTLNQTISNKPGYLSSTISHETESKFENKSDTNDFKQNLNTKGSFTQDLNASDFNSTIRASSLNKQQDIQGYNDDKNEAASVDDIAKSITEEFASPSFAQGILPNSTNTKTSSQNFKSSSTTSLDVPATSKDLNTINNLNKSNIQLPSIGVTPPSQSSEEESRTHLQPEINTPSKPTSENNETNSFGLDHEDAKPPAANSHKRDFSISSYLDDYYDDNKELSSPPESSQTNNLSKVTTLSQPLPKSSINTTTSRNFSSSTVESSTTIETLTKPADDSDDGSIQEIGFSTRDEAKENSENDESFLDNIEDYSGEIKSASHINTWSDYSARSPQLSKENRFSNNSVSSTPTINDKSPSPPQVQPSHGVSPKISATTFDVDKERTTSFSAPSFDEDNVRSSTPEPHADNFNTTNSSSFDSPGSPLPMPASRFHIPGGRFSTASDSMRSYAGNETDDTASLSTGRKSPQSFSYSFRDSYDFRSAGLVPGPTSSDAHSSPSMSNSNSQNSNFTPDPSEGGAPTFDQIKQEIPGPTSPISKVGRWRPLDFSSEPTEDSSPSSTNPTFTPKVENKDLNYNNGRFASVSVSESESEPFVQGYSKEAPQSSQETNNSSNSGEFIRNKYDIPDQRENVGTRSVPALVTEDLEHGHASDDSNETPVTAEQNALERQIMKSFSGSSSQNLPSGRAQSPDISQQTQNYSSETPSASIHTTQLRTPTLSYDNGLTPQAIQSPVSPTVPDPVVAELYRDSSKLLSRPISQLITTGIPQTQPLNSSNRSVSNSSIVENQKEGDNGALAPAFDYNDKKETELSIDNMSNNQEQSTTSYSMPPVPKVVVNGDNPKLDTTNDSHSHSHSRSPSRSTLSSTLEEDDRSSVKSYNKSPQEPSTHSRTNSFAVKSMIVDSSPTISPVQSLRTPANRVISGEQIAKRRSSSLIINDPSTFSPKPVGRQQSLASLLNRPPVLDFQGILTRPRSVDRKTAFDLARQAQADYDSGLQTWILQVSASKDMKTISKSSAPIPQSQKNSGVLGTTGSIAANKVKHFAANSIQPRKLTSAFSEVSNKTHGLADKLHISGIGEKSSSAFSRLKFGIKKPKP